MKVSQSHNQSYTEIGSVYHRAYFSHILILPPLRIPSEQGIPLFLTTVHFFYKHTSPSRDAMRPLCLLLEDGA